MYNETAEKRGIGMRDSKELMEHVEECDEFEQCSDCRRYLAGTGNHRCRTDEEAQRSPNRAERRRRARADTRRDDTSVGVFRWNGGTSYAYHDLTNGEPRCGCHQQTESNEVEIVTLARAKARGWSPCGNCRQIR